MSTSHHNEEDKHILHQPKMDYDMCSDVQPTYNEIRNPLQYFINHSYFKNIHESIIKFVEKNPQYKSLRLLLLENLETGDSVKLLESDKYAKVISRNDDEFVILINNQELNINIKFLKPVDNVFNSFKKEDIETIYESLKSFNNIYDFNEKDYFLAFSEYFSLDPKQLLENIKVQNKNEIMHIMSEFLDIKHRGKYKRKQLCYECKFNGTLKNLDDIGIEKDITKSELKIVSKVQIFMDSIPDNLFVVDNDNNMFMIPSKYLVLKPVK